LERIYVTVIRRIPKEIDKIYKDLVKEIKLSSVRLTRRRTPTPFNRQSREVAILVFRSHR